MPTLDLYSFESSTVILMQVVHVLSGFLIWDMGQNYPWGRDSKIIKRRNFLLIDDLQHAPQDMASLKRLEDMEPGSTTVY